MQEETLDFLSSRLVLGCAVCMVTFAPVFRGGNRQVALAALLALGMLVLALAASQASLRRWDMRGVAWHRLLYGAGLGVLLTAPLWLALIQLWPVDAADWASLPARSSYLQALQVLQLPPPQTLPLSLSPEAGMAALWAGVPLVAAILAGLIIRGRQVPWLLGAMLLAVAVQLGVSLAQFVQGPKSLFYFDSVFFTPWAPWIGTFNNRNHLANLLVMGIPAWFALLAIWRAKFSSAWPKSAGMVIPLWYFFGFAIMVVLMATQSRGGLLSAGVTLVFCLVLYISSSGKGLQWMQLLALMALAACFVAASVILVGKDRVTERFESNQFRTAADFRNQLAASTWQGGAELWPWGSGAGSYESVFPRFQHVDTYGYANYAHNDYAQWLMEFGAPGVVLGVVLLGLVVARATMLIRSRWRFHRWRAAELNQCYAGVGVLALALHCWVEFNLHVPALAITASILLGVYLRPPEHRRQQRA